MRVTADIHLTPQIAAAVFADWGDEDQAQFFIEVAEIAKGWDGHQDTQWYSTGRHLRTCECSSPEARSMVAALARGAEGPVEC